jgi:type IV secretion system protein TrbG
MRRSVLTFASVLALVPLSARAAEAPSALQAAPPEPPAAVAAPAAPGVPAPEAHSPRADPDGELASIAAFQAGTAPPVIERPDATLVPYGYASATIRCAPLRVCAVELARGESVLHVATGDSERWAVQPAATGPGGATPLLLVKPTACNVTTNLVATTDRHVYQILLESPPCDDPSNHSYNPRLPYTPLVRFYHPDEYVQDWSKKTARAAQSAAISLPLAATAPESLRFDYAWHADRRFPWVPQQVFDDGARTYIHLPRDAAHKELPVLTVLDGGKEVLVNYAVHGDYYVADRTFDRAALLLGDRRLVIERRR